MAPSPARYDEVADWYVEYTRPWGDEPIALRPTTSPAGVCSTWRAVTGASAATSPIACARDRARRLGEAVAHAERRSRSREPQAFATSSGRGPDTDWWDGVTFSTYLNAVLRAGLVFEDFTESATHVPVYFAARCRRPA